MLQRHKATELPKLRYTSGHGDATELLTTKHFQTFCIGNGKVGENLPVTSTSVVVTQIATVDGMLNVIKLLSRFLCVIQKNMLISRLRYNLAYATDSQFVPKS